MDTATFLLAFRRFEAKRGKCTYVLSDHGSNFIGAQNDKTSETFTQDIKDALSSGHRTWSFIPPHASHFAGVWERKIAPVKRILEASLKMIGKSHLAEDEFTTLLDEAAAIVNSTPMADVPSDPNEPFPPSPSMLLTLREFQDENLPEFDDSDVLQYGRKRWRRVQALAQGFWSQWCRDYASQLQKRSKWTKRHRNLEPGDVVLLRDSSPRNVWPMGLVKEVKMSDDGLVRSAILSLPSSKTGKPRTKERPVHELVMLVQRSSDA